MPNLSPKTGKVVTICLGVLLLGILITMAVTFVSRMF